MTTTELFADDRLVIVHADEVMVCGWRDAPTPIQMRAMEEHGRAAARRGSVALVNVAFSGVPKFSDEVRELAAAYTRDATLFARSRAHVVMIPGFKGAAVMAFINTFVLLGRPPRPTKVFRAIAPATVFTAQHLSPTHDAATVAALVEDARARLGLPG